MDSGPVITGITYQDLAEMLGTYRETTIQTLNEFKAQGLVEIGRKRIDIQDPKGLHELPGLYPFSRTSSGMGPP